MKIFKSHFWYTKSQRNGVFFFLLLIIVLQVIYVFVDFSSTENINTKTEEMSCLERQIDSLKELKKTTQETKIYPFNPNYITDYKGYVLGMTTEEIDRLHQFRNQNKFINSVSDFQKITKVTDSLLNEISPYFKFPDWVVKKNKNKASKKYFFNNIAKKSIEISVNDINLASENDFITINGIGEKTAERIVKYRKRLKGFTYSYQLYEVWNVKADVIKDLLSVFSIKQKPVIPKVNINTAKFKEVLKTPYVDYDLCKKIFDYRDEVAELQDISELKNIEDFPNDKYERIVLYLKVN